MYLEAGLFSLSDKIFAHLNFHSCNKNVLHVVCSPHLSLFFFFSNIDKMCVM